MITIAPLGPAHEAAVEALADQAFGPGRFARTAYLIREGHAPIADLSLGAFCVESKGLVASIQFTPVEVDGHRLLLLGPLVVDPTYQGKGVGLVLLKESMALARQTPAVGTVLIGDKPYYARVGFDKLPEGQIQLPGPYDPERFLGVSHHGFDLASLEGPLTGGWHER
ncbi:MAG: N-acetyltransferase [Alphaproteobacteria bacterium]|nr:MAG: N-acetyltransferase [Alphaproteobacteria bacterium]